MSELNVVELIERNPITKLSQTYNGVLISKIQKDFCDFEQQLFVSSFYCYLNYDNNNDYVIDFDNIWQWIGFSSKQNAVRVLERNFIIDIDYKIPVNTDKQSKEQWGGHTKQKIVLTIDTFKLFCLKAQTTKATQIHKYYIKMEKLLHEVVEEESDELKKQLEQKDLQLEQKDQQTTRAVKKAAEQATIAQFPRNTQCVYIGTTNNLSNVGEKLIKFGQTNDLQQRVYNHRGTFTDFILITAFRVTNSTEIENLIRSHTKIKKRIRDTEIEGKNYREMIAYDEIDFTIDKIIKYIKGIIDARQYSIDNFNALTKQNEEYAKTQEELLEQINALRRDNLKQLLEIENIKHTIANQTAVINAAASDETATTATTPQSRKFDEFVANACIVRPDVEESTVNLEGQFRIYCQTKPSKETFHAFKSYLDTKFKHHRLTKQDKNSVIYGYIGIKLKPIEYIKTKGTNVENFLFQICRFSPCGKVLNSKLLEEYQRWKTKLDKPISDTDMKEIKDYLNESPYALKSVVWTTHGSNEGYYGLSLRSDDEYKHKLTSSTGKKVEKRLLATDIVLDMWETIAKAATSEQMSPAKMSRSIKNKTTFGDCYYVSM